MLPLFNSQAFLNENKWAGATLSREQRRFRRFFAPLADPSGRYCLRWAVARFAPGLDPGA
jgi:hypothetical protein